jgi:23S rRNA pseudouridine1911/1915/1917 synthase
VPINRGWTYREQVGPEAAGRTVLSHLTATRGHSSEEIWAERIDRGEVEIDGAPAGGDRILGLGQIVVWRRPPWDEPEVPTNFTVIHEDDSIVAVNKPSGLPTMPAGGYLEHTLMALVRQHYPGASPLHRLGRFTSGLVLFARTPAAASTLARAWRDREVRKTYRALAEGTAATERFDIDAAIGPVPHPVLGSVQAASGEGKASHSLATVLERRPDDQTLFSVEITTGRPHQIRIHLAWAWHPMVGDPMYQAGGGLKDNPGLPGDGGYWLHAERLEFSHPATGASTILWAAPPPKLQTMDELIHGITASGRAR